MLYLAPGFQCKFKRMPLGLKNATSTLQKLMVNIFRGIQGKVGIFVCIGGIIMCSNINEEGAFNLIMTRLRETKLKL